MKKISALLLAALTAALCLTSCADSENGSNSVDSPEATAETRISEESTETDTTDETTTTVSEESTTTSEAATETTTVEEESAVPFGDFFDVGYTGDYIYSDSAKKLTFSAGNSSYTYKYGKTYSDEKSIRLAEYFKICKWDEYKGGPELPPMLQTDSHIQFMKKDDNEIRFVNLRKETSCLTYIRAEYDEESGSNGTVLKLKNPEISKYAIDYDDLAYNISDILGMSMVESADTFSVLDDSDLHFNFAPYYHPSNMTLVPPVESDPFGAFSIPDPSAFAVEKNTAAAIDILKKRNYRKITNEGEIPAQKSGADIEKCYKLGNNPTITTKADKTIDQVIIMCTSNNGCYIINIVSGKDAVISFARYEYRTEGDKKICANMDDVKSGHNIEWYRCDGDLAGEIRNTIVKQQ